MNPNVLHVAVANVYNLVFVDDSSSSSEEEENDILINIEEIRRINNYGDDAVIPVRIENFLERTIPNSSDQEFRSHFRIARADYEILLQMLTPMLEKNYGMCGKSRIDVGRQILCTLWLLATPDSYRSVGNRFNMGKSSLFVCFTRVVEVLMSIAQQIIKWPNEDNRNDIKIKFRQMAGLPHIIGAVDGTYVPIKAPKENAEVYVNRKCFYGITLQCICTPSLKFTDCFTGYPSSVSDNRIFRNSDLHEAVQNNLRNFFAEGEYIIGDKAYPIYSWCIPPYIDRGRLTNVQVAFNTAHARSRQVIERAFALLYGRFRRLRHLDMNRLDLIPTTIIACCVLHNICLMNPDELINEFIAEGQQFVQNENVNYGIEVPIVQLQGNGGERRDELARELIQR